MRKKLNIRQEKFCQKYLECGVAVEAMLYAYPSRKKWKRDTQDNAAYKLTQNGEILARLKELKEEASASATIARNEILGILGKIIRGESITDYELTTAQGTNTRTVSVSWAIDRLCKMCGYDEPDKHDISIKENASREELERELKRLEQLDPTRP